MINITEDLRSKRLYEIYPTITSDKLHFKYNGNQFNESKILNLCNLTGMVIQYNLPSQTFSEIDISSIPNGIYVANILLNNKLVYQNKIVKISE